jgi:hypothetical protein
MKNVQIEIIDQTGKTVLKHETLPRLAFKGNNPVQLNLDRIASGNLFLQGINKFRY